MSKDTKQSLGGKARDAALTPERKSEIARKGALAKIAKREAKREAAATPTATHRGNFSSQLGVDVECYVLNDEHKTAVISQRGMSVAVGLSKGSGGRLHDFINGAKVTPFVGRELAEKLANPLVFKWAGPVADQPPTTIHGYDVTILIDICKVILAAKGAKALQSRHDKLVEQATILINASAKAGIKNLVYALAGFDLTRDVVIAEFKRYVSEEARQYEREFPEQLYREWYRLYELTPPERNRPFLFKTLTLKQVYTPLARSNGKILELARAQRGDDRHKKLHQFLSEIGVKALRTHLGRLLGLAEASKNRAAYEQLVDDKFGPQLRLDL